jgi:cell division ATPase FtsA
MLQTVEDVASIVKKEGLSHLTFTKHANREIKKAFVVVSAPWCLTQTKIVEIKRDFPFILNKKVLTELIKTQVEVAENSVTESFSKFEETVHDIETIEKKIIQFKANGYLVNEVLDKEVRDFETTILVSSMPKVILDKIKRNISKHLSFKSNIIVDSFTLTFFTIFRDMFPDKENYLLLDLSSEISNVSVVRDQIVMDNASFPLGRNMFVRQISNDLNVTIEEAFSLLAAYHNKNLDPIYEQKIETSLNAGMKIWSESLHKVLEHFSYERYIPRSIVKITNDDFGYYFAKKLGEEKFSQLGFSDEPFNVIIVDVRKFKDCCKLAVDTRVDSFTYINSLFLNRSGY